MILPNENESMGLEASSYKSSELIDSAIERVGTTEVSQFEQCELLTNQEVASYLQELPPTHLENIQSIQYEPNHKPENSSEVTTSIQLGIPGLEGWASATYSPENMMSSFWKNLTSEIGVRVYFDILVAQLDLELKWSDIHKSSLGQYVLDGLGLISEYGQEGEVEDFSESYAAYVLEPESLQSSNDEKYDFIRQEIFYGREYWE